MTVVETISEISCELGEGAFWHPERESFFWVDILGKRLMERDTPIARDWAFDRCISAMGWIDRDTLLLATERDLVRFDLKTGTETQVAALEADMPRNRSNDGRADPMGGFWIGTMGFDAEPGAGAIYRYYRGELRQLYGDITVSNAICFAPGGRLAYFTDTRTRIIKRVALDGDGWPSEAPQDWLDLNAEGLNPDGAVVDAEGRVWNAQWGASRVACYAPDGTFLHAVDFPATQVSCPAFGGADLDLLFVTTAAVNAPEADRFAGMSFAIPAGAKGQPEPRVIL